MWANGIFVNMVEQDFIFKKVKLVKGFSSWESPSNIALIKYWGKYGEQLPENPSISFTLSECKTITKIHYRPKKENEIDRFMKRKIEGEGICEELTKIKIPKSKQEEYRKKIYDDISGKILGDLTVKNMKKLLTDDLLIEMFELYDKYYFNDKIKDWPNRNPDPFN